MQSFLDETALANQPNAIILFIDAKNIKNIDILRIFSVNKSNYYLFPLQFNVNFNVE